VVSRQDEMERVYGPTTWDVYELLDESLLPRGSDSLLDLACSLLENVQNPVILDAGCRDAHHLIQLVTRTSGGTGMGVDPVAVHIERAHAAVAEAKLGDRIAIQRAGMERVPVADDHFDLVWCRDVLEQVSALNAALRESARVLKRGGRMVVFTEFVTDLLAPREGELLSRHLGNVPDNLDRARMEVAFADAGLRVERVDEIGTEWREYAEQRTQPVSRALLRLARLRRQEAALVERFGRDIYEHVQANLHWEVFQFLGKLQPVVYVLSKR
jgi:ubiquinone/menaquinone biosynthesis C-methylase UbiE